MVSAGRVLLLPKGNYSATTTYDMLDLVAYNGITWLCKRQCIGITPSDSESLYWQKFGSAAPIASTTVPGLVMPDGNTITLNTTTGAIAVPIALTTAPGLVQPDGTTISISAQGVISCSISDLEDLGDVVFSQLANGQTLVYNASNQTWQNGNVASALSALSDVVLTNPSAGDILLYDNGTSKWINAKASANLSLSDTKPVQNATVTKALTDVVETVGSGASRSYSAGDIIVATSGTMYKATTDIAQNTTLTVGGNIEATSQRALNTNLTQNKIGKFSDATYVPVDSIAYDETNQVLGLKVNGADTVIPFSKGESFSHFIGIGNQAWSGNSYTYNCGFRPKLIIIQPQMGQYVLTNCYNGAYHEDKIAYSNNGFQTYTEINLTITDSGFTINGSWGGGSYTMFGAVAG